MKKSLPLVLANLGAERAMLVTGQHAAPLDLATFDYVLSRLDDVDVPPLRIDSQEVIVMVVDASTEPDGELDDGEGPVLRTGDLVLICPGCGARNSVVQRDRATCWHELDVEEDWISVADTRHADFHDLDQRCGSCEIEVHLPDARECEVVWG